MNRAYKCNRFKSVGAFQYTADFSQASSNIMVRFGFGDFENDDDRWQPVPFQVADTGHDRRRAERMIAKYFR